MATNIVSLNAFGSPLTSLISYKTPSDGDKAGKKNQESSGIWTQASYINHCCTSTARRAFIGDMMIVRANCDMEAGTEVTFWYHNPGSDAAADLSTGFNHWGFACDCAICKDGKTTSATVINQRKNMFKQLKNLFHGTVKVNKIGRLLDDLDKTYTEPANVVPRLDLYDPLLGLAQAYIKQGKPNQAVEWTAKTFVSLGYVLGGADSSSVAFIIVKWGIIVDVLVLALLQLRETFKTLGLVDKSKQAEDYARLMYKIVVGEDSTFDATHG